MSLQQACDMLPDDLPDGAFFAMAHELAGAEYGDAWDELESHPNHRPFRPKGEQPKPHAWCCICRKRCAGEQGLAAHWKNKHPAQHQYVKSKSRDTFDTFSLAIIGANVRVGDGQQVNVGALGTATAGDSGTATAGKLGEIRIRWYDAPTQTNLKRRT